MPPVINALLATGFDWRAGVWQAIEIVIGMAVYLPFMKISEKAIAKQELSPSRTPNVRPFHLCGRGTRRRCPQLSPLCKDAGGWHNSRKGIKTSCRLRAAQL